MTQFANILKIDYLPLNPPLALVKMHSKLTIACRSNLHVGFLRWHWWRGCSYSDTCQQRWTFDDLVSRGVAPLIRRQGPRPVELNFSHPATLIPTEVEGELLVRGMAGPKNYGCNNRYAWYALKHICSLYQPFQSQDSYLLLNNLATCYIISATSVLVLSPF